MRRRQFALRLAAAAAALVVAAFLIVGLPVPRSALARVIIQIVLYQHGHFHMAGGTLRIGAHDLSVSDLQIVDARGEPAFGANELILNFDPRLLIGRSDRAFGLESVTLNKPHLRIIRYDDGTFNLQALQPSAPHPPPAGAKPAPLGPPYRITVTINDGIADILNPSAPASAGHKFTFVHLNGFVSYNEGGLSTGKVTGTMIAQGRSAAMQATLFENDVAGFAKAAVSMTNAPIAPFIDALIPSKFFAVDAGTGTMTLQAYAFGYGGGQPQWRMSGIAAVRDTQLRVVPLIVPVRGLHGRVRFDGTLFSSAGLSGAANGVPISVHGGIQAFPDVEFALDVTGAGPLRTVRTLFAFSRTLPIDGRFRTELRVSGPLHSIDVDGPMIFPGRLTYANVPMDNVAGRMFYNGGHITLSDLGAAYNGGRIYGYGDIDLSATPLTGQFIVAGTMSAARIPIAANINPTGTAKALISIEGPLSTISGEGYAQIKGGNGVRVRTMFAAGPKQFALGPMLVQGGGGELLGIGAIDRTQPRSISGELVAINAPVNLVAGAIALPGIGPTISLPATSGRLNGAIQVGGPAGVPSVDIAAKVSGLRIASAQLGDVAVIASGAGQRVRIAQVSFAGRDVRATANGYASLSPPDGMYAAVLHGNGAVNLGAMGPTLPVSGHAAGAFEAVLSRGRWLVSTTAASGDAAVAGIAVQSARGIVGGGRAGPDLIAATAAAAGGEVAAIGDIKNAGSAIGVWADNVSVASLRAFGTPLHGGTAYAMGSLYRGPAGLSASGSVALTDSTYRGVPVQGDAELAYASGRISGNGRADVAGNAANINGAISSMGAGTPKLDLHATLRQGSLALADRWLPSTFPVTGSVGGDLHITGSTAFPRADGQVWSDTGTIRGVAYENFSGTIHVTPASFGVDRGAITFGTSTLAISGYLSRSAMQVAAASPRVTLSDFNDFFNGWDTLEGNASMNASVSVAPHLLGAGGFVAVRNAQLVGIPFGSIDASFGSSSSDLIATVHQSGPIGAADLAGSISLPPAANAAINLRHANVNANGSIRNLDLAVVAPLVGADRFDVSGLLDARGVVRGQLDRPAAHATFALRQGSIKKLPIDELTGTVESDGRSVALRQTTIALPFAAASGSGRWYFDGRVTGDVQAQAKDLTKVAARLGNPTALSGSAAATIHLDGTVKRPLVHAAVQSTGSVYAVRYDRFAGQLTYAPGQLEIGDAQLDLSAKRGSAVLGGTLPLELSPLGLGPPSKRMNLRLDLRSIDLAALDPLTNNSATLTGTVDASASATGTAGRPILAGSAQVHNASISSQFESVPATGINAALSFHRDSLDIASLHGRLGSGSFDVKGAAHVVPAVGLLHQAGLAYWSHVVLRGAQVNVPNWINGTFDGDVSLTKTGATPYLSGDVTMNDGVVPLGAVYALATRFSNVAQPAEPARAPGVPPLRPGHTIVYGGTIYGDTVHVLTSSPSVQQTAAPSAIPLADLKLALNAGKNVSVKGGGLDLRASGGVTLGGSTRALTLAGAFTSDRGLLTYFDRNFRILAGTVAFDPTEGLLPTIYAKAITFADGNDITVEVSGRIDHLNIDLSSIPPMTRDQIVAVLLHETALQSVVNGNSPNAAQSAVLSAASGYFNAQLSRSILFPFETALSQTLNIETIAFTFDPYGNVDVEVRKRISATAFGIYRSSLQAPVTQSYGFAYSIRDRGAIEFLQTQKPTGLQSFILDIRYQFH